MGKYLKSFESYNNYVAGYSSLYLPNVSLINQNNIYYNRYHDYVEIGGIKWATMNIGAEDITDTGLYFQWGDIQGYQNTDNKLFTISDYDRFGVIDNNDLPNYGLNKYNTTDEKIVLENVDDAALAIWHSNWRIPTNADFQSLNNAVNSTFTQINEVYGLLCIDKTDNTKNLFFPAAGYLYNGNQTKVNEDGRYWSSSLNTSMINRSYQLGFNNNIIDFNLTNLRYIGCPIRPVFID